MSRVRDIANILSASTAMATDAEVTSAISSHTGVIDPHPFYLKEYESTGAGKNKIMNGDFSVWQRGTTFTATSFSRTFLADRFYHYTSSANASYTVSRRTLSANEIPLHNFQYCFRFDCTSGGTGGTYNDMWQPIEDVNTFAGKTVNFSFWARTNSGTRIITPHYGQNFGSGGSADIYAQPTSFEINTTWERYSVSFTIPSISGKTIGANHFLAIGFRFPSNNGFTIDITGLQLELGDAPTAFTTCGGNPQAELAACQRYYYRHSAATANDGVCNFLNVGANGSTLAYGNYKFKTTMRTSPSLSASANTTFAMYGNGSNLGACTVTQERSSNDSSMVRGQVSSGMVSGYNYWIEAASNNTAYIEWSSEL